MKEPLKPLAHSLSRDALSGVVADMGEPSYRAGQIWSWLYRKPVEEWAGMTNLSSALRSRLSQTLELQAGRLTRTDGEQAEARNIHVGLRDGESGECVLIPAPDRRTVCVSTQCGCRFRCSFCASGQAGFARHLETGEIVIQALLAWRVFGEKPTHVVFMGIGEPLDNYDNVLAAIRIFNDADGLEIGARRLTISTCGVVPGIRRLAGEGLQVELSVSLHAADNDLRSQLMPVNMTYPIAELLDACRAYTEATKRIITFEYTLIAGVNDSAAHAGQLVEKLRAFPCRVNLIPLSSVSEFGGRPAKPETARRFIAAMEDAGINATLRDSKGSAIKAACGQLRYAPNVVAGEN
jgi:23S rRNA (adenine2503-C2)-methyltransferase